MDRSNSTYYINPSSISIIPNANGKASDLAVNITNNAKISVYSKDIPALGYVDGAYQQWTLNGRNRRISGNGAYNIYARLHKDSTADGYLVFSQNEYILSAATTVAEGLPEAQTQNGRQNYWWIKIGTVSAVAGGERTVDYDTGILGTQQYNNEWQLEEDSLPMRVVIDNTLRNANPPYIAWGENVTLTASLIRGWENEVTGQVHHWVITRDTGDAAADAEWNDRHGMDEHNQILLQHQKYGDDIDVSEDYVLAADEGALITRDEDYLYLNPEGEMDDFNGAVAAAFTIMAYGYETPDSTDIVLLATETITILTETKERYEIVPSATVVHYNPKTQTYNPSAGIAVRVRCISQDGVVSFMTQQDIEQASLVLKYDTSASESVPFVGGIATIPISKFHAHLPVQLYLTRRDVLMNQTTIGYVEDGVDGRAVTGNTEHYKASTLDGSTGHQETAPAGTAQDPDWNTDPNLTGDTNQWGPDYPYLWNYEKVSYDKEPLVQRTQPRIIAIYTEDGDPGRGISSIVNYYAINNSATTAPTTGWSDTAMPPTEQNPYLWNYERINWTIGTPAYTDTTPHVIGHYGKDGNTPVITIGSNDKHWYIDGVDTGVKAEGEDGTGVQLNGTRDVVWNADKTDPDQTSLEELYPGHVQVGDCYVVDATRHLYFFNGSTMATATLPYGWTDLGEFKGADGLSSYMHMAWADGITFAADGITPIAATGFTTVYGSGGHNYEYDWIGFCTDNNADDPVAFGSYKWNYQKGKDGDGYEYVYLRAKVETAPLLDETVTDSHGHTRTDDDYLPALAAGSTAADYAGSEFTDDPQGVSSAWPYEYQAMRKKVNGSWQAFSPATLHRSYSDSAWIADLDNEMDAVQTTPTGNVVTAQSVQSQFAMYYGNVVKTFVIDSVQRNNETPITQSGGGADFVNASWTSAGMLTLSYAGGARFSTDKDTWTITMHPTEDVSVSRQLKLIVNWTVGRIYNLNPSVSQMRVGRTDDGGYSPSTYNLTCGYRLQNEDGTISVTTDTTGRMDGLYNIYFRRRLRSTGQWEQNNGVDIYYRYGYSTYKAYVTALDVSTYDAVEFVICTDRNNTVTTPTSVLDRETVPVVSDGQRGDDGESPYLADLDTDMLMLHTTGNGKPTRSQNLSVIPTIRKGEDSVSVSLTGVKRNGTAMTKSGNTWSGQTGVTVVFNSGVIGIAYTTAARISNGKDTFTFTLAHIADGETLFSDDKTLTVTAFAQDQYSLLPSAEQIIVTKVGNTFDPATFTLTCGYRKIDIDNNVTRVNNVLSQIDGLYNLYFRRHKRSTGTWENAYYLYSFYAQGQSDSSDSSSSDSSSSEEEGSYWLTNASVATYDGVEFILCKNTALQMAPSAVTGLMYTAEVPVIQNGAAGATGPSYYYKGEWYDTENEEYISTGTQIQTTDYERPFISYTYNGVTTYYLYIGAGTYSAPATRTSPAGDAARWTPMQSENKFIIADAIFSDFAKFGSAVMNKDWMISANGRIDGVEFYVTDLVTGKMVDSQSSTWSTSAYVLFDNQNPKATSQSKLYEKDHTLARGATWNIGTVNLTKDATYSVRTYAQVSAIGADVRVRVSRNGVGQTDVLQLFNEHASGLENSQAFFRVSEDGEYTVSMIAQNVGNVDNEIEVFEIAQVSFAPIYALDLYTGKGIQRDLLTSGFIRKDKTVINLRNVAEYVRTYADERLDFEKCGSFIEIRDDLTVGLVLPLLYRTYNYNTSTQVWTYSSAVYPSGFGYDADYVRSLVGTKLIVYLTNGHINGDEVTNWDDKILKIDGQQMDSNHRTDVNGTVRIDVGSFSCNLADTFLRRISHESITGYNGNIDYLTFEREILLPGEFIELECVSDTDCIDNRSPYSYILFDGGYEVIYWRVNKKGKMLA